MLPPNVFTTANFDPVHRSTRDALKEKSPSNAHTFDGYDAAAMSTDSVFFLPGNGTCFQLPPERSHAVSPAGAAVPSNAKPVVLPVATTAVNCCVIWSTGLTFGALKMMFQCFTAVGAPVAAVAVVAPVAAVAALLTEAIPWRGDSVMGNRPDSVACQTRRDLLRL